MFCAAAAGWPLPVLPIQILLVNLVTDGLPAMALGVDPLEAEVMHRPPRPPGEGIFARRLGRKILGRGLIIAFGTLLVFWSGLWFSNDLATARTMALATLVLSQLTHAFDCRSEESSILELGLGHNPFLLAAVACSLGFLIAVVHWPVLRCLSGRWRFRLGNGCWWAGCLCPAACWWRCEGHCCIPVPGQVRRENDKIISKFARRGGRRFEFTKMHGLGNDYILVDGHGRVAGCG